MGARSRRPARSARDRASPSDCLSCRRTGAGRAPRTGPHHRRCNDTIATFAARTVCAVGPEFPTARPCAYTRGDGTGQAWFFSIASAHATPRRGACRLSPSPRASRGLASIPERIDRHPDQEPDDADDRRAQGAAGSAKANVFAPRQQDHSTATPGRSPTPREPPVPAPG
jgi:hypothetical protein